MKTNLFFDGAFGTYISAKKPDLDFPEMANITDKETVEGIHKEYINAGVTAIKTNTFAANTGFIPDYSTLKKVVEGGFTIAEKAAGNTDVRVFADIGPITDGDVTEEYIKLADIFMKCGAKNFLFETLYEASSLYKVIKHIKQKTEGAVIIASFAVSQDGYTRLGCYYKDLLDEAASYGADYVGLNCICGPAHMLNLIKDIPYNKYKLTAMPNAGYPTGINGRTVYFDNPDYFSDKLFEIYGSGVESVGGCCGTTPEHIRRFIGKIAARKPRRTTRVTEIRTAVNTASHDFKNKVIAVEVAAPIDLDMESAIKAAACAKESGADFITVPDSPLGKARANSLMISSMIQHRVGIKAIPHLCCRDKNQIALKGDLIASNIGGITNILALTGDSVAKTDRSFAKNVFGLNSYKLIEFIKSLNETIFTDDPYYICAALNINAANFDSELKRAEIKIENGASCLITQPVLSKRGIENYLKAREVLKCRLLAGILLVAGYKNALFLNNEVPGIEIPDDVVDKLKDKKQKEIKEISVGYAAETVEKIKDGCDGFYIITPFNKIDFTAEIIKYIRRNDE